MSSDYQFHLDMMASARVPGYTLDSEKSDIEVTGGQELSGKAKWALWSFIGMCGAIVIGGLIFT